MVCKYCGQDAGFLKRVHTTCEEEHNKAIATTQNAIANYFNGSNSIQNVLATLQHSSQHAFASEEDLLKIGHFLRKNQFLFEKHFTNSQIYVIIRATKGRQVPPAAENPPKEETP